MEAVRGLLSRQWEISLPMIGVVLSTFFAFGYFLGHFSPQPRQIPIATSTKGEQSKALNAAFEKAESQNGFTSAKTRIEVSK